MTRKCKNKGWKGEGKRHSMARKGIRSAGSRKIEDNGTEPNKAVLWNSVGYYEKQYDEYSTEKLLKMAQNLEKQLEGGRHPRALRSKEEKEEHIDQVNRLHAMTLVLDKRGVPF